MKIDYDKPFSITSVCRADLIGTFTKEQIASLDDEDMEYLASKMANAYTDEVFWIDLKIIAEDILRDKAGVAGNMGRTRFAGIAP